MTPARPRKYALASRPVQVAGYLRQGLQSGYWQGQLPAERALANEIGVSRRTLRAALNLLEHEGFLLERTSRGTFLPKPEKHKHVPTSIGILFQQGTEMKGGVLFTLNEMRKILEARRIHLHTYQTPHLRSGKLSAHFLALMQDVRHDGWILFSPPKVLEQWFLEHRAPAMLYGSGVREHGLPSISVDFHAMCRHAAGEMLRLGHRHLSLILPQFEKAEDVKSRSGFQAGVESSPHRDVSFTFDYHDQSPQGICHLVDRLLIRRPRPTAWLVCRQGHFITLLSYLLGRGVRIPDEVSVISRNSDVYLDSFLPLPTRYEADIGHLAKQAARLALRMIDGQDLTDTQIQIMPKLLAGQTLGPVPECV